MMPCLLDAMLSDADTPAIYSDAFADAFMFLR